MVLRCLDFCFQMPNATGKFILVIFEDLGNKRMLEGNLPPFSDGLGKKRLERQQRMETAVSEDQQDE